MRTSDHFFKSYTAIIGTNFLFICVVPVSCRLIRLSLGGRVVRLRRNDMRSAIARARNIPRVIYIPDFVRNASPGRSVFHLHHRGAGGFNVSECVEIE